MKYIKALISGEKKALERKNVKTLTVPKFKELSMERLWDMAMKDDRLRLYLPERIHLRNKRFPNRDFLLGVLNTLDGDHMKELLDNVILKRYETEEGEKANSGEDCHN
jgi:hypothetical protein